MNLFYFVINIILFGYFPLPGPQRTDIMTLCNQGGCEAHDSLDTFLRNFVQYVKQSNDAVVDYDTLMVRINYSTCILLLFSEILIYTIFIYL